MDRERRIAGARELLENAPFSLAEVRLDSDGFSAKNLDALAEELLTPQELAVFTGFGFCKRRQQWLGGRMAAKEAARLFPGPLAAPGQLAILPDENGRPWIHGGDGARLPLFLSISHSGDLAVAMVAGSVCGIDIQQVTASAWQVRRKFLCAGEEQACRASVPDLPKEERSTLLWAAKEAVRKSFFLHPLPAFPAIRLLRCSARPGGLFSFSFQVKEENRDGQERRVVAWPMAHAFVALTLAMVHTRN